VSGVFTGLAGALWVPLNGLTTPDIMHWTFSGEIVFMTVLGGFRSVTGPIVGAIVFNYLKTYAVGYTVYWQLLLGVILVVLVLSLPTGIVGTAERLWARWRAKVASCWRPGACSSSSASSAPSITWTSAYRRVRCWR